MHLFFFFLPLQPAVANLAIGKNVMRISLSKFHLLQLCILFLLPYALRVHKKKILKPNANMWKQNLLIDLI